MTTLYWCRNLYNCPLAAMKTGFVHISAREGKAGATFQWPWDAIMALRVTYGISGSGYQSQQWQLLYALWYARRRSFVNTITEVSGWNNSVASGTDRLTGELSMPTFTMLSLIRFRVCLFRLWKMSLFGYKKINSTAIILLNNRTGLPVHNQWLIIQYYNVMQLLY